MSLEFNPIHCATSLCQFGQTHNGYVATHSIFLSSTADSSATSGYVVVLESFGQYEEPAIRNGEQTKKSLILFPAKGLNNAICRHMYT